MKRTRFALSLAILTAVVLGLAQCEFFLGDGGNYNLSIDLGEAFASGSRGIGAPPITIASYTVTVTAPDMTTIEKTVPAGARYINMYIPNGLNRTIRLDANVDPATAAALNREHLLSLAGEVMVDLLPGRIVMCRFYMHTGMTKLIIPEYGNSLPSGKLVRIPNMTPSSSDWLQETQIEAGAAPVSIRPWEIDFDSTGRIFFQDRYSTYSLVRIDQLIAGASLPVGTFYAPSSLNTFAVDYINDYVYYDANTTGTNELCRCPLDLTAGTIVSPQPMGLGAYRSMMFDSGALYILGTQLGTGNPIIIRYLTSTGATTHTYVRASVSDPYFADPRDILVKGRYVYVTNWNTCKIGRFDESTLTPLDSYGVTAADDDVRTPGYFYGPHHFIAIYNKKIYIIDEGGIGMSYAYKHRIIAFDNIETWSGWETFRAEDAGQSPFTFYEC